MIEKVMAFPSREGRGQRADLASHPGCTRDAAGQFARMDVRGPITSPPTELRQHVARLGENSVEYDACKDQEAKMQHRTSRRDDERIGHPGYVSPAGDYPDSSSE